MTIFQIIILDKILALSAETSNCDIIANMF